MKIKEFFRPTWINSVFSVFFAVVFLWLSQFIPIFFSGAGSINRLGFPLIFNETGFYELCPTSPCLSGYQNYYYVNLAIDFAFWLVMSYILFSFVRWLIKKLFKKKTISNPDDYQRNF